MTMEKLFLLDAYALIFRAYYAFIKNPRINSKGMNTSAIMGFVNTLEEVLEKERPTHLGVAFDPSGPTFRHEAYPQYKAQREETPEAIRTAVPYIKKILEAYHIPILEVSGYEADDVIGTLARQADSQGIDTFMMTPDKDYAQLVTAKVRMYRPSVGKQDAELLGPEEVKAKYGLTDCLQVIDMLGLMGDTADNIPGCPGVGEKTAQKLIQQFGSVENLLEHTDEIKGALRQKVEENREQITFSKWLAMASLSVTQPDLDSLKSLYEELEFRALLSKKMQGAAVAPKAEKAAPKNAQLNLFGDAFGNPNDPNDFNDPNDLKDFKDLKDSKNLKNFKDLNPDYQLIDSPDKMAALCDTLLQAEAICLDTETTSTESMRARLVGLSFAIREGQAWYVPVPQSREGASRVVELFRPVYESGITKIGQNLKYDMMVLQNHGITLKGKFIDTMIAHYLISPELHHGMDYMAETLLNYQTIHIEELIGPKGKKQRSMAELSPQEIYVYACEDADVTLRLEDALRPQALALAEGRKGPVALSEVEEPLVKVLCDMEREGVRIDVEALKEYGRELDREILSLTQGILAYADPGFNPDSPKQLGELLFGKLGLPGGRKTSTGQFSTDEKTLAKLAGAHPVVPAILDYRACTKLKSTYVDKLPTLIDADSRVHTTYSQAFTETGRLSSSDPNLQNIPVRTERGRRIRAAFVARDDRHRIVSADYSQIELRLMAAFSGDEAMLAAFRSGADIHRETASRVYGVMPALVSDEQRSKCKMVNFGIIYGISAFGLSQRLKVPRREAEGLIESYFRLYPGVRDFMAAAIAKAREKGYAETMLGRRRTLRDIDSRNATARGAAERDAINTPIQGSAADLIKIAMVRVDRALKERRLRAKMVLQIHDELVFDVPEEEVDEVVELARREMTGAYDFGVPLEVGVGVGRSWLDAH